MRKILYWATYNAVVGGIGLVSVAAMLWVGSKLVELRPGEDFVEPLALWAGIFTFGMIANIALLAGVVHLNDEDFRARFRRVLKLFSLLATAPIWIALLSYVLNRV